MKLLLYPGNASLAVKFPGHAIQSIKRQRKHPAFHQFVHDLDRLMMTPPVFRLRVDPGRMVFHQYLRVVEETAKLFGGLPYDHYTFLGHVAMEHGGGLEHRNSTVLGIDPLQLLVDEKIKGNFIPLVAHEFFHTWNVKRILPAKFQPYDLQVEVYTNLLWLFEGFTTYYELPILARAGVVDDVLHLGGSQPPVHRDSDRAELGEGEDDVEELRAVAFHDRHPVAEPDTGRGQRLGRPAGSLVELTEGDGAFADDERGRVGATAPVHAHDVGEGGDGAHRVSLGAASAAASSACPPRLGRRC